MINVSHMTLGSAVYGGGESQRSVVNSGDESRDMGYAVSDRNEPRDIASGVKMLLRLTC